MILHSANQLVVVAAESHCIQTVHTTHIESDIPSTTAILKKEKRFYHAACLSSSANIFSHPCSHYSHTRHCSWGRSNSRSHHHIWRNLSTCYCRICHLYSGDGKKCQCQHADDEKYLSNIYKSKKKTPKLLCIQLVQIYVCWGKTDDKKCLVYVSINWSHTNVL